MKKNTPSAFGRYLRKLRVDRDEKLMHMAINLGVSPAFLSSVELGKKNVPRSLPTEIAAIYKLKNEELISLQDAAEQSLTLIRFDLSTSSDLERLMVLKFSRNYKSLNDSQKRHLTEFLNSI